MSRTEKIVFLLALALAALLLLAGVNSTREQEGESPGLSLGLDLGLDLSDDLSAPWLCQPSDIDGPVDWPHPLYRRPKTARGASARLREQGWRAWYLSAPSEGTGAGL